jgi:predicted ATPase/class 3 adenylate cyclase
MRTDLPSGTVTFVFTDVEGSTKLLRELGSHRYADTLADHRRALREAFGRHGGVEVDTQGDAFFIAFATADGALGGVRAALEGLAPGPIRVRVGVHTGTPLLTDEGYVGEDVHRAARIGAAGHGGQVLLSAATAGLVDVGRFPIKDLGEHRFKDLARPERIFQLGAEAFPAIRSLSPSNLPVPATPFLGRERELGQVLEILRGPSVRLLTLTGPGGTGKTRLAIQAAAESSDLFPGGLWWVALAPLDDPSLVLSEVAGTMGAEERVEATFAETIAESTGGRRTLILLDNAEHLLPSLATEIAPLTRNGGGTTFLVTSREPLHLEAEQELPIPAMDADDAVAFFRARAEAAGVRLGDAPSTSLLCRKLDNLPLAMQLAAARLKIFSVEQLLERLSERLDLRGARDSDPRQQTLRATIEWSHDLLDDHERILFRRLSVFAGGATIDAIEAVCEGDPEVLLSLVDKSLVRRRDDDVPEPRFWMLETIDEFASEQLRAAREEDELRGMHARWCLAHLEGWDAAVRAAADRRSPLQHLDPDLDNMRAALTWATGQGDGALIQDLAGRLRMYWHLRGLYREGRRWSDLAYRQQASAGPRMVRVLDALTSLAYRQGDDDLALRTAQEALPLARSTADGTEILSATTNLANALSSADRLEEAGILYDEALEMARTVGTPVMLSAALVNRGDFDLIAGRYEEASAVLFEALEVSRAHGVMGAQTVALLNLATVSYHLGRDEDVQRYAVDAIRTGTESQDMEAVALLLLAGVQVRRGNLARAGSLLGASEALRESTGYGLEPAERAAEARLMAEIGERLSDPDVAAAYSHGRSFETDEARSLVFEP